MSRQHHISTPALVVSRISLAHVEDSKAIVIGHCILNVVRRHFNVVMVPRDLSDVTS